MNAVERWVNGEGPEPDGIRELMDAARDVPEMTLEQAERMERALRAALLDRRRAPSPRQRAKWVPTAGVALAAGVLLAAGIAAATASRVGPAVAGWIMNHRAAEIVPALMTGAAHAVPSKDSP